MMQELESINNSISYDNRKEQKLERLNKGINFFNIEPSSKKYFIEVMLKIDLNLIEKKSRLVIESDVPFVENYWKYGQNEYDENDKLKEFLSDLREWVKKPYFIVKEFNRKDTDYWKYGLQDRFRKEIVKIEDIDIIIGNLAEECLKNAYLMDFEKELKKILSLQREATEEEKTAVNRWIFLKERIKTLNKIIGKKDNNNYYYSNEDEDMTLNLPSTRGEYNNELKKIETEMKVLVKKFPKLFEIKDFEYFKKPISYEKWKKKNLKALKGDYMEEDEGYTFEDYCEDGYEQYVENLNGG